VKSAATRPLFRGAKEVDVVASLDSFKSLPTHSYGVIQGWTRGESNPVGSDF
jgi:hypothetical protein